MPMLHFKNAQYTKARNSPTKHSSLFSKVKKARQDSVHGRVPALCKKSSSQGALPDSQRWLPLYLYGLQFVFNYLYDAFATFVVVIECVCVCMCSICP